MQRLKTLAFASSSIVLFTSVLAGCGISAPIDEPVGSPVSPGPSVKIGPIKGTVMGGGIPIVGAKIFLFAASQAGYGITTAGAAGSPSTSLLTINAQPSTYPLTQDLTTTDITYGDYYVTTDSTGAFSLSGDYTCTTGTHLYLFSLGGQTTSSSTATNSAAGEMSALPDCPATGLTYIYMNEVSTVAAAYAFAGFAYDAVHVGAAGGVGTLADTGIKNAFLNASNIYDISNQLPGNTGGSSALATSGNVTRNQALVDTLANIVQYCINGVDTGTGISAHCTSLFGSTGAENTGKTTGKSGTTATGETATAAIFIAHNPSRNVSNIYTNYQNTAPAPFSPYLSGSGSLPNDFSIQLKFTGGGLGSQTSLAPHDVAVDASGNIWVSSFSTNTLSEFNTLGVPAGSSGFAAASTGFSGNGLSDPLSVAIDTSGNVWVANATASSSGYIQSEFSSTGVAVNKYNPSNLYFSTDAEFDSAGKIWYTAYNGSNYGIYKNAPGASAYSASETYSGGQPYTIAPTSSLGLTWIADTGYKELDFTNNADTVNPYNTDYLNTSYKTNGVAVDSANRCWSTEVQTDLALGAASPTAGGSSTQYNIQTNTSVHYTVELDGIAIDGAGSVWVGDDDNGTVFEISSAAALLSNAYGYPAVGNTTSTSTSSTVSNRPDGLAIDGSGNVWYRTLNDNSLREIVGIATPVVTPLAYGVAHGTQGTRP